MAHHPRSLFAALLALVLPVSAQNTASYQFSTATGENGTSLPITESIPTFQQLPHQSDSEDTSESPGILIGRSGTCRADRFSVDLAEGLSLFSVAETSLSLADATTIQETTVNYQRPYSRTELGVVNEKLYPTPVDGQAASTVRLTAFLDSDVTGVYPDGRFWRNSGSTVLNVSTTVRKRSNDQIYSNSQSAFRLNHTLNYTTPGVSSNVTQVFGGSNGAWNPLANNGTGFIDVSVPADAYVLVQVSLSTLVEITQYGASAGNALSTFRAEAKARVSASHAGGGALSTELGLSRLRQLFPLVNYADQPLTATSLTLSELPSSGLSPVYELVSGPASLSGNVLSFTGSRGTISFRATQAGNLTFAPASISRSFEVLGTPQTITFPAQASRPANHAPFAPGAVSDSGLPVVYQVLSGPATTDGTLISPTGTAGQVVVRATQPGNGTYYPAIPVDSMIVLDAPVSPDTPQTITFPQLLDTSLGVGQLVMATSSSGLPVTLTVVEGSARLDGVNRNILVPTGPGIIRVRATQAGGVSGGISYFPASEVERTMTAPSAFLEFLISAEVPPEERGPEMDADSDGVSNLVEFALGGDPADPSDTPAMSFSRSSSGQLELSYQLVRNDVTCLVQVSHDLVTWTTDGVNQGTPDGNGNVTATASSTATARFMRLAVSYP